MRTPYVRLLVLLALALAACDTAGGTERGTPDAAEDVHDASDHATDAHEDSGDQRAADGDGSVYVDESSDDAAPDPGPLALTAALESEPAVVGRNALLIRLTDEGGVGVPGGAIAVDPQMPSMGHGSREDAEVEDLGDGDYRAFPVTFTMPGEWEVTIEATVGARRAELVLEFEP